MARLKSPKSKGDLYERELASFFNERLFSGAERVFRAPLSGGGRTFSGGGSADLLGTPDLWVEAKRTERFSPYEALAQAERGRLGHGSSELVAVISRRNRMPTGDSLVVMRLSEWLMLYHAFLSQRGVSLSEPEPASDSWP